MKEIRKGFTDYFNNFLKEFNADLEEYINIYIKGYEDIPKMYSDIIKESYFVPILKEYINWSKLQ